MTLVEELQKWQKDLEALGVERGKAEGRLEQAMTDLSSLGFKSIEEAEEVLEELREDKWNTELKAEKLLDTFREKYADFITPKED